MKIICIARGQESKGSDLARSLADKLGFACYSRADLIEEATQAGIAVGKLETAMLKPNLFNERLTLEKEHYLAFATARLCERVSSEDTVYHGRTGHLLLPGVAHLMRIRVVENLEDRISSAAHRLRIPHDKARQFIEQVDHDIRRWGKTMYARDWEDGSQYDLVINLDKLGVANAASALCSMAQLTEFQETPASHLAIENLYLAARARISLARDSRTHSGQFRVSASKGLVQVTYRPQDLALAPAIPEVVEAVDGVREVHASLAASNLLWLEERFDPASPHCAQIIQLARSWNAAIDLMRVTPGQVDGENDESAAVAELIRDEEGSLPFAPSATESVDGAASPRYHGGIEDDDEHPRDNGNDGGLEAMFARLSREGVAGGMHMACGSTQRISSCLDSTMKYYLVVIGDLFLDKGHSARLRQTRELASHMTDTLGAPVVEAAELQKTYLSLPRQLAKLALYLVATAAVIIPVMTNQIAVLHFLTADKSHGNIIAAVTLALVVPLFAFVYGTFTKGVLRLFRIE